MAKNEKNEKNEIVLNKEEIEAFNKLSKQEQELFKARARTNLHMQANRLLDLKSVRDFALREAAFLEEAKDDPPAVQELLKGVAERMILKHANETQNLTDNLNQIMIDGLIEKAKKIYAQPQDFIEAEIIEDDDDDRVGSTSRSVDWNRGLMKLLFVGVVGLLIYGMLYSSANIYLLCLIPLLPWILIVVFSWIDSQ